MRRVFSIAAALALVSCGKADTPNNPGESSSCTVTLSGAVTGTYDCKAATTVWSMADGKGGFGFAVQSAGINVAIGWPGEPSGGASYGNGSEGIDGGVTLQTGSGASTQVWSADTSSGGHGSFALHFSGVSNTVSTSQGKAYTADGTLTATLVPLTGQSGNVTVSVTF